MLMATAMPEVNAERDFIVEIVPHEAPSASHRTGAERTELTNGAEPPHMSEVRKRGQGSTPSMPDVADDETSLGISQTSTASTKSKEQLPGR